MVTVIAVFENKSLGVSTALFPDRQSQTNDEKDKDVNHSLLEVHSCKLTVRP